MNWIIGKGLFGRQKWRWKEATDRSSAPLEAFLVRKDIAKNEKNVDEAIFYLKTQYQPHSQEQGIALIEDIPNQEDQFTFETISARLKLFLRSTREAENMTLKNKVLQGAGCQQQRKYSDVRKIEGKIRLGDLNIGWRENAG